MTTHTLKFYPVGNGDCSQIILDNGKRLLFDFCHRKDAEDNDDPKIDLKATLSDELNAAGRDNFDVVALTHLDEDHIANSTDFFYLEHAGKYQDGERKKIDKLWVPAAAIVEEGLTNEGRIWRQEARYRFKAGEGIRVFSRPDKLKAWLESEGLNLESRQHIITDAGQIVPEFSIATDQVEFFTHSPFSAHVDGDTVQRNESALIFQSTFEAGGRLTRYLMVGDSTWDVLEEIVDITRSRGNDNRLTWDIYNVPHHCSYLALGPEKGNDRTIPVDNVQWLLDQCQVGGIAISSSNPIPNEDTDNPPYKQAAATYRMIIRDNNGHNFEVTMEHQNTIKPKPIEIEIGSRGAKLRKLGVIGAAAITSSRSPRAGSR